MLIDITSPEDRANVFRDLSAIASLCLSEDDASKKSFNLLFNIWESISRQVWDLCYWNDYSRCANLIFQAAKNVNNLKIQAQSLGELGYVYMENQEAKYAQKYFQESLQKYQLLQDFSGECRLLRYLGTLAHRQKKLEEALKYYHQAQEIVRNQHSQISMNSIDRELAISEAELPNVLGTVYLDLGDFVASYQQLHISLENYQILIENNSYNRYYIADPLLNLGRWHFLQKRYKQAKYYYKKCLSLSQELSRNDKIAEVLLSLAQLAEAEGNIELAIQQATEAEQAAGIEIPALRDRAALEKERLLSQQQLPNA
jgi:tetratricopeptide (TPR) repeat protein